MEIKRENEVLNREQRLEEVNKKLLFWQLPNDLRKVGVEYIPKAFIEAGYNPLDEQQKQVAVYGKLEDLKEWSKLHMLPEETYQIHKSNNPKKPTYHIDIYGINGLIEKYIPENETLSDVFEVADKIKELGL